MALPTEIKRLIQPALAIKQSSVSMHRVMDILATESGDVSEVINRFRDIKEPQLRAAFHHCAVLLKALEKEAGLVPAWDQDSRTTSTSSPASTTAPPIRVEPMAEAPAKKSKYRPDQLAAFESETDRGKHRVAKAYTDGASRGNPGDSGIGVVLQSMDGKVIAQATRYIGKTTNNQAEYLALIEALKLAERMGVKSLHVLSDSQLMVRQVAGQYQVKNADILQRVKEVQQLRKNFEAFKINYIAREGNDLADALSTASLPKKVKSSGGKSRESDDFMGRLDENPDEGGTE